MSIPYGPILVVEDMPQVLQLLQVALRFKGYPVVSAANGQEALERVASERPALVITDILMPKMDGFTLIHRLFSDVTTSRIPVIVLSATYITPEDKEFALKLGAVRFLEKPVDTEEFLLTVAEVLTMEPPKTRQPLDDRQFYQGYRQRLEAKLSHKNAQIARTERLLQTLPVEQRPAFEALLAEEMSHRSQIQHELDDLYRLLEQFAKSDATDIN
jgi:CheY-like chemotaxis protein